MDLAVKGVSYVDGDPGKGAIVTIENRDPLVMPVTVQVDFKDGTRQRVHLPAETWIQKTTTELTIDSVQPIASVTIDPDHVLPDKDRSNNVVVSGQ